MAGTYYCGYRTTVRIFTVGKSSCATVKKCFALYREKLNGHSPCCINTQWSLLVLAEPMQVFMHAGKLLTFLLILPALSQKTLFQHSIQFFHTTYELRKRNKSLLCYMPALALMPVPTAILSGAEQLFLLMNYPIAGISGENRI